jgi:hypothetical protein
MTKLSKLTSLSVLLALLVAANMDARTPEATQPAMEASWNEAGALILGHKIAMALPNGAVVEGKVLSLNLDSIDLQVSKTSDSQIQPKGKIVVPRTAMHTVKLIKPQKKWRIILTSAGAGVMIPLVIVATASYNEVGGVPPPPLPASMAIGGSVGYLAGWLLDGHHDLTITIH